MRMTSKSSHSLVQRIHHALKRKDPVPASREVEKNEALQRALQTIETESIRYRHLQHKPWLDDDGNTIWPWQRVFLARIIMHQAFETGMGLVIFANVLLIVFEANADASCYPEFLYDLDSCPRSSAALFWPWACNLALQTTYSAECIARCFVERGMYVKNQWNVIDLVIVVVGWFGMALTEMVNLNVLRVFRVLRLLRAGRLLISVPELYILLSGLTTSIKAIFFGSIMLIFVVFVWAIVMVELIHPLNLEIDYDERCPRCKEGFQTVYMASLTLFQQIVAGDSWGAISLPLAEAHPWTSPILFAILMTISLGVMNLILAVIVEKAAEARQNDLDRKLQQKDLDRERNMVDLALLCDRMDTDGSGALSLEEMLHGYVNERKFYTLMQESGIEKDDLQTMFNVLDSDDSGEVDYVEFCNQLGKCPKRDPMMLAAMTRYSVMEVRKILQHDIQQSLNEQKEFLQQQLEILCHIPSCEVAGRALQRKLEQAKHLKATRTRKMATSPSSLSSAAAGAHLTSPKPSPSRPPSEKAEVKTVEMNESFRQLQEQLRELSLWAADLQDQSEQRPSGIRPDGAGERPAMLERPGSNSSMNTSAPSTVLTFSYRGKWAEIDRMFLQLRQKFEGQLQQEEVMKEKCAELINVLESMLEEQTWVVREDL